MREVARSGIIQRNADMTRPSLIKKFGFRIKPIGKKDAALSPI
jgi:hypothetical protein